MIKYQNMILCEKMCFYKKTLKSINSLKYIGIHYRAIFLIKHVCLYYEKIMDLQ